MKCEYGQPGICFAILIRLVMEGLGRRFNIKLLLTEKPHLLFAMIRQKKCSFV